VATVSTVSPVCLSGLLCSSLRILPDLDGFAEQAHIVNTIAAASANDAIFAGLFMSLPPYAVF
jgi:hypothetical protein